jgi:pectate lyase
LTFIPDQFREDDRLRPLIGGLLFLLVLRVLATESYAQLKAFPTAEGFGALATGGRGGSVYHVTNLNDSGSGSLRDALSQSNRTVVFDVGGVINISSRLVFSSNITVAGQTAPGGIAVYGDGVSLSNRSNIIVRNITFRAGIGTASDVKAVNMTSSSNIILDHVSIGWARYDNFGITKDSGAPESRDITIQNSLIHEAINNQRAGGIIDSSRKLTLARNLFTNNDTRNPKGKGDLQFINNVIYNYGKGGYVGGHSSAPWYQDLINNYFIAGPSQSGDYLTDFGSNDLVYHSGNKIDDDKVDTGGDGLPEGRNIDTNKFNNVGATVQSTAHNFPTIPVTIMTTLDAFKWAVAKAGNALHRDSADQRQINQLKSLGTQGYIPADETQVGGMPTWIGGIAPTDTDADGMPDAWELGNGLNISNAADRNLTTLSPEGYTNLEVYLNSLMAPLYAVAMPGDFNADNKVDAADYVVWRNGVGTVYTPADYETWQAHFGQMAGSGAGSGDLLSTASVPEPATFYLAILAGMWAALPRRGRAG